MLTAPSGQWRVWGAWKTLTQWKSAHAVVTPRPGFLNLSTIDFFGLGNPFVETVLCTVGIKQHPRPLSIRCQPSSSVTTENVFR